MSAETDRAQKAATARPGRPAAHSNHTADGGRQRSESSLPSSSPKTRRFPIGRMHRQRRLGRRRAGVRPRSATTTPLRWRNPQVRSLSNGCSRDGRCSATHHWTGGAFGRRLVLFVDADERCTPELAREVREVIETRPGSGLERTLVQLHRRQAGALRRVLPGLPASPAAGWQGAAT